MPRRSVSLLEGSRFSLQRFRIGIYRGTLLTRNIPLLGPYSRTIPRVLRWSQGGGAMNVTSISVASRRVDASSCSVSGLWGYNHVQVDRSDFTRHTGLYPQQDWGFWFKR